MKKIVVAGCGIGGLVAAANLSAKGFDVTVYEASAKENLGHDWCDSVYKPCFSEAGIECPPEDVFTPSRVMRCCGPSKRVRVTTQRSEERMQKGSYIDRKFLARYLIENAEKQGAKFIFNAAVLGAVVQEKTVCGLRVILNGKEETVSADLVIDSAGINSPVRKNLPASFRIMKDIDRKDVLYTYRVYFDKVGSEKTEPFNNVYFYHCGKPSLDWVIPEEDYVDILVSGFGSLTRNDIDKALLDFRSEYPFIGKKILRGGTTSKIPLRKSLPLFVADGYAAVGDSAIMIEPLSGSGIRLGFFAGKLLADTVEESDGNYSIEALWKYQYKYFKETGEDQAMVNIVKEILPSVRADDMDYLFESEILGVKALSDARNSHFSVAEILNKVMSVVKRPQIYKTVANAGKSLVNLQKASKMMPENYEKKSVREWMEIYEKV